MIPKGSLPGTLTGIDVSRRFPGDVTRNRHDHTGSHTKRKKRRHPRRTAGTWGSSTIPGKWMTTLSVLVQVLVGG
jgi:hypothetical protein